MLRLYLPVLPALPLLLPAGASLPPRCCRRISIIF